MTLSRAPGQQVRERSLSWTSTLLVAGKAFQMGSGFLFWVIAARAASVADMGTLAASVAAVMLCTQIGVLGVGSAMIIAIGRGQRADHVLDTGFTIVALTSSIVALGYIGVSRLSGGELASAQSALPFAAAFVVASIAGTALICFDQACISLGKPSGAPVRYVLGGVATLLLLGGLALASDPLSATTVFAAWTLGSVVVCVTGAVQLRRWVGYRYHVRLEWQLLRQHLAVGIPNHLLTMTERLPALLVPLLVAHLVSPVVTAYWYPAWMLVWVAYSVPIQVGLVQFSEGVRRPGALRETVSHGFRWGLLLGCAAALPLVILADPLLRMIGADYADGSAAALRVLALGIVPLAIWQAYNARCRTIGAVREGLLAGVALAALTCSTTVLVASHGATALAVAWVCTSAVGSIWAGMRLLGHRGDIT